MRNCWCGNPRLLPFGPEYGECNDCGTLVYLGEMQPERLLVRDDDSDFYGKNYWLERQQDAFGTADIFKRARTDLAERNLHWLQALLKYRLPPAMVLELGCSHGSFVGLMQLTGFDASGMEMSPWVVDFGAKTFGVPTRLGPLENADIPPGSLDVIVSMDVLEHLPDPVTTMARCLELLKPDGLLLLQTPKFSRGTGFAQLVDSKARFLEMLIPEEHIYLFSEESVSRLFRQLGAEHVSFEPAIFAHYDMFLAVSRSPLTVNDSDLIETTLNAEPQRRYVQALLDLRARELASESDRLARGEQIETLTRMVKESEADRTARGEQIETLTRMVKESESARIGFGAQIQKLKQSLASTEAERNAEHEEVTSMVTDLRALFGHKAFRLLAKIARWREAKKLENRIKEQ